MTALGVCQQGKCLIHPSDLQSITRFLRVTGKIGPLVSLSRKKWSRIVF